MKENVVIKKRKKNISLNGIHCFAYQLCVPMRIESQARSGNSIAFHG